MRNTAAADTILDRLVHTSGYCFFECTFAQTHSKKHYRGETRRPLFCHKDSIGFDFSYQPGVKNLLFMYLCTRNCLLAVT